MLKDKKYYDYYIKLCNGEDLKVKNISEVNPFRGVTKFKRDEECIFAVPNRNLNYYYKIDNKEDINFYDHN